MKVVIYDFSGSVDIEISKRPTCGYKKIIIVGLTAACG